MLWLALQGVGVEACASLGVASVLPFCYAMGCMLRAFTQKFASRRGIRVCGLCRSETIWKCFVKACDPNLHVKFAPCLPTVAASIVVKAK